MVTPPFALAIINLHTRYYAATLRLTSSWGDFGELSTNNARWSHNVCSACLVTYTYSIYSTYIPTYEQEASFPLFSSPQSRCVAKASPGSCTRRCLVAVPFIPSLLVGTHHSPRIPLRTYSVYYASIISTRSGIADARSGGVLFSTRCAM